jgi:two-component system, cell cycle sensor histidine kinase and response regulator CckA
VDYVLKDLLDIPKLQELLDSLNEVHCLPSAIIDIDGNILTATAWQDICTKFHRVNPDTEKKCLASDRNIGAHLDELTPHVVYRCPMGLADTATPIVIEGKHLGNIFTGQFLMEPPDESCFINQARQYGFDEAEYLAAVRKVPIFSEEQLHKNLNLLHKLTQFFAEQGLKSKRLREAELDLKDSNEFLALAQQSSGAGVWDWDMTTGQLRWSPELFALFGIDLTGRVPTFDLWRSMLHPDDLALAESRIAEAIQNHIQLHNEYRIVKPNGEERWINALGNAFYDDRGEPYRMSGICIDISDSKMAENLLQENRNLLDNIINGTTEAIYVKDLQGRYTLFNTAAEGIVGKSAAEVFGHDDRDLFRPEEAMTIMDGDRKIIESGVVRTYEENITDAAGNSRAFMSTKGPLRDANGNTMGTFGVARDITDRKQAVEDLRISEAYYRSLFDHSFVGVVVVDRDFIFTEVNRAFCKLFGYEKEEIIGKKGIVDIVHPDDGAKSMETAKMVRNGKIANFSDERRYITKCGKTITGLLNVTGLYDQDGGYNGCIASILDITERKRAEDLLRESRAMLHAALNSMTDAVCITNAGGELIEFNNAFETFYRYKNKEECSKNLSDCYDMCDVFTDSGELAPLDMWAVPRALRGETVTNTEYTLVRKDTGETWVGSYSFGPIRSKDDEIVGSVIVGRDVTESKKAAQEKMTLEAHLHQAQKMESVGRLAGGVAHDFNNMLSVIMGHAEMALMGIDPSLPVYASLTEISNAAQRSADLTRQLLAFARKQTVAPRVIDLNKAIAGMLDMLQRMIGENIRLDWQPAAQLWPVLMDAVQVDQIMANLCVNARDAIADIGVIVIETENCSLDEKYFSANADALPGDYVKIVVRDDGTGMEQKILDRIFEPFYTTKGLGEGTGLGLATVYGIVKQNNGAIDVYSKPGAGTTFTLYLPRYVGRTEPIPQEGAAAVHKGKETVLLVEDEPAILEMTTRLLTGLGYRVLKAGSPGAAIRLAREHSGDISLLMTDVIMPEMNGRELAKNILSIYPRMKRLFMSGYTADIIAHHGVLDEGVHFIQKPFPINALAGKLREVLDGQ